MIKMDYGDAEHRKKLEETFVALLDDADERQKTWGKLRKRLYNLKNEFKMLLPTQYAFLHRWQAGRRSRGICGSSDGASEG